jgi:hypothetical protein
VASAAAVRTSSFWRELSDDEADERFTRVEAFQDLLRARAPERTLETHYDRRVGPATLADELRRVLTVGHGPGPFGGTGRPPSPPSGVA